MLNEDEQSSDALVAFTDASHGIGNKSSGAAILMPEDQTQLHSVHVMSYGKSKRGIVHSELRASVDALHIAPPGSLRALYSDCSSSVERLQKYKINIDAAAYDKMLSVEDVVRLRDGLARHPDIEFSHLSRKDSRMKIADKFSRMARGQPEDTYALRISDTKNLQEQLRDLSLWCDEVLAQIKAKKKSKQEAFTVDWINFPDLVEA